ncbi:MAG: radical SAM protein [Bacteroidota bacterium]|nr:radical SAM protein [Bacteroidota bacterium]
MNQKILLITPPFTQLNTPYPATMYLKGFFNTRGIASVQADLGIEVILKLFSSEGFRSLFQYIEENKPELSSNAQRMVSLKRDYIQTIDAAIAFLQDQNSTLAQVICEGSFLPEASRFTEETEELEWAFGTMGTRDKARHLITLYLEDISDLIIEAVDPQFGFSRYAESLGRCATSFDALEERLNAPASFVDEILLSLLQEKINQEKPTVVGLSVPFPGNLYSALKCGQWLKANHPEIKVVMGGGYPNTELRTLREELLFKYVDFVTLDDGELPLLRLLEYLDGKCRLDDLKRTFTLLNNEVCYLNESEEKDFPQSEVGTPDYSDLLLDKYLSVIEIVNPMHRLWSDGRWNKLTLAHGCYWGKCSFCDCSLDYIRRFEPNSAALICDRMEAIIRQTEQNGFHFVDEAAPPALLRDLALEILRRGLRVSWWTNIRFEKNYTADLCALLKEAGCIAVSGGLEVASDRLLKLINKGVTVAQVAKVADNFTQCGIMVHAYLMYGFPTQTDRETIDSLEMVRQLFQEGVLQSGFWHLFTMTAHSPIGLNPQPFGVQAIKNKGKFANNDVPHIDRIGTDHQLFGEGLRKSLFNYMHGVGFDIPLAQWFDFKVPPTTIPPNFIQKALAAPDETGLPLNRQVIWLGNLPEIRFYEKKKKGKTVQASELIFHNKKYDLALKVSQDLGKWLAEEMASISIQSDKPAKLQQLKESYEAAKLGDFVTFWNSRSVEELRENGLLLV